MAGSRNESRAGHLSTSASAGSRRDDLMALQLFGLQGEERTAEYILSTDKKSRIESSQARCYAFKAYSDRCAHHMTSNGGNGPCWKGSTQLWGCHERSLSSGWLSCCSSSAGGGGRRRLRPFPMVCLTLLAPCTSHSGVVCCPPECICCLHSGGHTAVNATLVETSKTATQVVILTVLKASFWAT